MANKVTMSLLESARAEIDREDAEAVREEIKKYLKLKRWDRIRHPVFQRGVYYGGAIVALMFLVSIFMFGPIFCK